MSDFDDVSSDENEDDFPKDYVSYEDYVNKHDELEDSILGGLLKESSKKLGGKNNANKQANFPTSSTKLFKENTSIGQVRKTIHSL